MGKIIGTENDYNDIIRALFKRVSAHTNESYSAMFSGIWNGATNL